MVVARWIIVGLFALVSGLIFTSYSSDADETARRIASEADANEVLSKSAIQQQVGAAWATRDAALAQLRHDGIRNGLLGICAAMLTSIAVSLALRERRETSGSAVAKQDSDRPKKVYPPPGIQHQ